MAYNSQLWSNVFTQHRTQLWIVSFTVRITPSPLCFISYAVSSESLRGNTSTCQTHRHKCENSLLRCVCACVRACVSACLCVCALARVRVHVSVSLLHFSFPNLLNTRATVSLDVCLQTDTQTRGGCRDT